jgi:outer membrane protein assembly factor BamD (BamD/ComL family)
MKILPTIAICLCTALIVACSSAESDWKKAETANTAAAFQDFLNQHPNDTHASEARDRLGKIEDDQAWSGAQATNTVDAYQQYLQKQPNGAHVPDANTQIADLQRAADWKTAQAANTPAALQDFLKKYNRGPEVDQAHAQLLQLQGYRVQLATSPNEKAAQKSLEHLQAHLKGDLPAVAVVPPAGDEKLYKVASQPMSQADAESACEKLKKSHQHCEVVKS